MFEILVGYIIYAACVSVDNFFLSKLYLAWHIDNIIIVLLKFTKYWVVIPLINIYQLSLYIYFKV